MSRLYSIIISGYKDTSRETLSRCLSLDTEADVGYEVIFLDNTGDGRHLGMANELFSGLDEGVRTVYVPHAVPGKAEAQNLGIGEARGDFLVFLDDDVLPNPDLVLQYDRGFAAHDCAAIQGRVELLFEEGCDIPTWLNERFRLDLAEMDFGREIIPFEMGLTGANMAYKASLFEKYGLFDERLGPGRSGTLEDQEFSERIKAGGEVQLFWPAAGVRHVIPPERLTVRSFAGIYYDVGFSDYFLSHNLIRGGRIKFSLHTIRKSLGNMAGMLWLAATCRKQEAIQKYCELFRFYGYWKQAMQQHWVTQ